MDVFGTAVAAGGDFLRDAAIDAGYELGVYAALERMTAPTSVSGLAAAIDITRGVHRLGALLDVLAAYGAVARAGDSFVAGAPPTRPVVPKSGWGLLAGVIRADQPLALEGGDAERRMHLHLVRAGAAAARELAPRLAGRSLLDLGGGAGAYTAAFLDRDPDAIATIVDTPAVIAIAREELARFGDRVAFVTGDARTVALGERYDCALLANLLHLHGLAASLALCRAARRAVRPGGRVVIKDLRVDDDRRGPLPGLLFALNMALYTADGDVHPTRTLRELLHRAGLVEIREHRLGAADDAIVVIGRAADPPERPAAHAELAAALAQTAPGLAFPAALHAVLADAVTLERADPDPAAAERAANMVRHYTETMPRMRTAQLADAALFHARLDWTRLPRLAGAIDRLYAVVTDAGAAAALALDAPDAAAFRARATTLAALYARTHYGGSMPLLYGSPADLAEVARTAAADGGDVLAAIDRHLAVPVVHELCHFAPDRDALAPPHLDECVAGWLGVHVLPAFAYPGDGDADAIYAAPWLAQVGQAIARAFGIGAVVRAHAGAVAWADAVPRDFVDAAARLGRDDWRARRTLHFLSDTLDPAPWVGLALVAGSGRPLAGETLASLARVPLADLAAGLRDDPDFDRAIVTDALRAMCLDNRRVDGTFRTRTAVPDAGTAIEVDALAATVAAPRRGDVDTIAPRYWLPPAVAARIQAAGLSGYAVQLESVAAIPAAAAALCEAPPARAGRDGFALAPRRLP